MNNPDTRSLVLSEDSSFDIQQNPSSAEASSSSVPSYQDSSIMRWSTALDNETLNTPVVALHSPYAVFAATQFGDVPRSPPRSQEHEFRLRNLLQICRKRRKEETRSRNVSNNGQQLHHSEEAEPPQKHLRTHSVHIQNGCESISGSSQSIPTLPNSVITSRTSGGVNANTMDRKEMLSLLVQKALIADEDGDRPIHIATVQEDVKLVHRLCHLMKNVGASVDFANHLRQTPLHLAVIVGNSEIIKILLNYGASVHILDRHGNTPIQLAVKYFKEDVFHTILSNAGSKAVLDNLDYEGFSALHYAVFYNNALAVNGLYSAGADINAGDGKSGTTALAHAILAERQEIVELLLKCKASVEKADYSGQTPLDLASQSKNIAIKKLLEKETSQIILPSSSYLSSQDILKTDISKSKKALYKKSYQNDSLKLKLNNEANQTEKTERPVVSAGRTS